MIINNIYNRKGIACMCNNTSYPEKIIISMLDQLNIKYTKEYKPLWSNNKRYDFYFELDNKKFIMGIKWHPEIKPKYSVSMYQIIMQIIPPLLSFTIFCMVSCSFN